MTIRFYRVYKLCVGARNIRPIDSSKPCHAQVLLFGITIEYIINCVYNVECIQLCRNSSSFYTIPTHSKESLAK